MTTNPSRTIWPGIIFLGILLIAATLRLLFLGDHSLWVDELFSIRYARLGLRELLADVAASDNHPPLYYALLRYWVLTFGESEFAVRSLSAFFGVLTVAVVYRLGTVLYDQRTGVLTAAVLAVASFSIYWSQEARMYSLLPLLAAVSVYYLWQLMREGGQASMIGYLVSTAALLYTQSYGLFIVAAQNGYLLMLWLLGAHRELALSPKRWIGLQLGVVFLFLPWLIVLASRVAQLQTEGFWIDRPTLMTLAGTFSEFSGSDPVLRIVLTLLIALSATPVLILVTRIRSKNERFAAFRSREFQATTLLFWCLLTPLLAPFAVSQFATPIYLTRPAGVVYFAFALLVARGGSHIKNGALFIAASLTTIAVLSFNTLAVNGYNHRDQPKHRELVEYVRAYIPPQALIVTCDDGQMSYPFAHYAAASSLRNRLVEMNDAQISDGTWRVAQGQSEVWVITFEQRRDAMRACSKLPELLRESYQSTRALEVPLKDFGIRVYTRQRS